MWAQPEKGGSWVQAQLEKKGGVLGAGQDMGVFTLPRVAMKLHGLTIFYIPEHHSDGL